MRSIADQATEELGGSWSVLVRQKKDHMALDRLLSAVTTASGVEQEELLNRISRLVFSHAFAEEAVLWPALRRAVPDGEDLTLRVEQEHQQITEAVAALSRSRPDDPERQRLLEHTVRLLEQDVRDEEDELLPRLQQVCDTTQLRRLGMAWEAVRRTAPTRTHPVVGRRPPGNVLAALPLSVLDRARDGLDFASRRAGAGPARTLRATSELLGEAARRFEHLPALRRGERPDTHRATGRGH